MTLSSNTSSLFRGARPVGLPRVGRPISARMIFPELEPANIPTAPRRRRVWTRALMRIRTQTSRLRLTPKSLRPEARDPKARALVYILNATLLFLAFPVGFGLLIFNVLRGENLPLTAHVMAATGVVMISAELLRSGGLSGL